MSETKTILHEYEAGDGTKEVLVFRQPTIKAIVDVMAYRRWLWTEYSVTEMARQIRDVYEDFKVLPPDTDAKAWAEKRNAALWDAIDRASDEDKHKKSKAEYWGVAELLKHLDGIQTPTWLLKAPTDETRDAWLDSNILKRRSRNQAVLDVLSEVFGEGEVERPGTDEAA